MRHFGDPNRAFLCAYYQYLPIVLTVRSVLLLFQLTLSFAFTYFVGAYYTTFALFLPLEVHTIAGIRWKNTFTVAYMAAEQSSLASFAN